MRYRVPPLGLVIVLLGVLTACSSPGQPDAGKDAQKPPAGNAAPPAAGLPRLLDLGSDKCIPCKQMAPILEDLNRVLVSDFVRRRLPV